MLKPSRAAYLPPLSAHSPFHPAVHETAKSQLPRYGHITQSGLALARRKQYPGRANSQSVSPNLQDCKDIRTQQLIYQINLAQTSSDLWVLCTDMQQCIAQVHGKAIAIERLDKLISIFEG